MQGAMGQRVASLVLLGFELIQTGVAADISASQEADVERAVVTCNLPAYLALLEVSETRDMPAVVCLYPCQVILATLCAVQRRCEAPFPCHPISVSCVFLAAELVYRDPPKQRVISRPMGAAGLAWASLSKGQAPVFSVPRLL